MTFSCHSHSLALLRPTLVGQLERLEVGLGLDLGRRRGQEQNCLELDLEDACALSDFVEATLLRPGYCDYRERILYLGMDLAADGETYAETYAESVPWNWTLWTEIHCAAASRCLPAKCRPSFACCHHEHAHAWWATTGETPFGLSQELARYVSRDVSDACSGVFHGDLDGDGGEWGCPRVP